MNCFLNRREWMQVLAKASFLPLIKPSSQIVATEATETAGKSVFMLETGQQVDRGGPVVTTKDNRVLWFTIEPEAPYLSPHVWALARLVVRESKDAGERWGPPRTVVRGTPAYSVLSHVALQLRSSDLIHIYVRYGGYDRVGHDPDKSSNPAFIQRSFDGGRTWSESSLLPTGERYISDVLSSVQISTGRVLYPFGFLGKQSGRFKVSVLYSDDEARTWKRSASVREVGGEGFESGASEPSVVELPDGRLWMLIRAQTGFLWESFSSDQGKTWDEARPSLFPSSNAPGTALRLASGKIVLVWNNHVDSAYARQSMVIAITSDGKSFSGFREIDHTVFPNDPAAPAAHVTYPFLAEASGGAVLVSYNKGFWLRHNRAKLARIEPSWIEMNREVEDFSNGRVGWCSTDPGPKPTAAVERYAPPEDNQPGASLEIEQPKGSTAPCGITRNMPLLDEGWMDVVLSVFKPDCFLLWHDTLLAPGQVAEACLRVRFSKEGSILLGVGSPTRKKADRRGQAYSYRGYPVMDEKQYPRSITLGKRLRLRLRFNAVTQKASFCIDDGPEVSLATHPVFGLCHFGIAVAEGGFLRLRRFESSRS